MFAAPWALLLLALVLPLAGWWTRREIRRSKADLASFGDSALLNRTSVLPNRRARSLRAVLAVTALGLGFLALARPQLGTRPASLARTARDLMVVLDLSRSMRVQDVAGDTRLQTAKRLARQLSGASPGDRLGLVVFGGGGFLQLPLTTDRAAFQLFLDAANPDQIDDPATNLAAGLGAALTAFEHEGKDQDHRAMLLLSDGERTVGALERTLARLRKAGIPVFAVGVGTLEGDRVPADSGAAEGRWHLDDIGRPVISHLVETDLRRVADSTGGAYARWDRETELRSLADRLADLPARIIATRPAPEPAEQFQWPLAAAVVVLGSNLFLVILPLFGRQAKSAVMVALLALGGSAGLSCDRVGPDPNGGERLYEIGKYSEARDAFRAALQHTDQPAVRYDLANAEYRMRRYEDAVKTYREALGSGLRERRLAFFNLGNAYVRAAEDAGGSAEFLQRAVTAYEEVLRLDPTDRDAKWNLELALRRMGESEEAAGSVGMGGRAEWGRGNMTKSGYAGSHQAQVGAMAGGGMGSGEGESAEELDEPTARRLLEAIEREQLSSHEGRPAGGGAKGERDW